MMYRNKEYVYNPREDITAYEVARMHLLITVVTHSSMDTELLNDYIDKYNLLRHFDTEWNTTEYPFPVNLTNT